jgi:DNA-binding Lrp family transcriptional regulator
MHEMSLDPLDLRLLALLQDDASLSNAELAERIGLSASQCSRRRAGLEAAGYIRAYRADLDAKKLGYDIEAFTRVTLSKHKDTTADEFAHFLESLDEVQQAHSVAGDADYLLHLRARSLDALAEFVHKRLLPHPHVAQVRSDIVLKTIKENRGFRIGVGAGAAKPTRRTARS